MADVFISFASTDRSTAQMVARELLFRGVSVWLADDLSLGQSWWKEITAQLEICRAVVCVWTNNSIDGSRHIRSHYMLNEHRLQRDKLVPLLFCDHPPSEFMDIQALDFRSGVCDARWSKLAEEVRSRIKGHLWEIEGLAHLSEHAKVLLLMHWMQELKEIKVRVREIWDDAQKLEHRNYAVERKYKALVNACQELDRKFCSERKYVAQLQQTTSEPEFAKLTFNGITINPELAFPSRPVDQGIDSAICEDKRVWAMSATLRSIPQPAGASQFA